MLDITNYSTLLNDSIELFNNNNNNNNKSGGKETHNEAVSP
jgi:hypothetical protein